MSKKPGFTLVEILVVIAVITVLIALLLPALIRARVQAQRVQCAAQLRDLATATINYTVENRGWFPDLHNSTGMYGDNVVLYPWWFSQIGIDAFTTTFGPGRASFYCPSNQDWNTNANWTTSSNGHPGRVLGYQYYGDDAWFSIKAKIASSGIVYAASVTATNTYPIFTMKFTDQPALQFLWADLTRSYQPSGSTVSAFDRSNGTNHIVGYEVPTSGVPAIPVGTGGQNIAYRDGHVEWEQQSYMARQWYYIDPTTNDITRGWW